MKMDHKDSLNHCQCCFSDKCNKNLYSEYNWMDQKEMFGEMLADVFDIKVSHGFICDICAVRLRDTFSFKKLVFKTQRFFEHQNIEDDAKVNVQMINNLNTEDESTHDVYDEDNQFGSSELNDDFDIPLSEVKKNITKNEKDCHRKNVSKRKKKSVEVNSSNKDIRGGPIRDRQNRDASILIRHSNAVMFRWLNNKYMCFCCKQTTLQMHTLRKHTRETHSVDNVIAEIFNRYNPVLPKVDISALVCTFCNSNVEHLNDLIQHLHKEHNIILESKEIPLIPYKLEEGQFKCDICKENFEAFKTLNNHMNKHFGSYICCSCGVGFQHEFALKSHEKRHEAKLHKCNKCQLVFPTSYKKLLHYYSIHKKGGRYGCPHCQDKFMDYDKRLKHLADFHGVEKPASKCVDCSKSFKNNRLLSQHVRYFHLNERKHVCDVCGKKYFNRSELRKHLDSHSEVHL